MQTLLLDDLRGSLEGQTVLVRLDLNTPIADGVVSDDTRIEAVLPTLQQLHEGGARAVVLAHLGRPKGQVDPAFSLAPVALRLSKRLGRPVALCAESRGPVVREAANRLSDGDVVLVENTRFEAGETKNDPDLAADWGSLARIYVNDAFGTAHRAHASTEGVARVIRAAGGVAVAGPLMQRELHFLSKVTQNPERPFVAIVGGAKISGKIDVVEALLGSVDRLVIGGAMANTFFMALGLEVGDSLVEVEKVDMAKDLLERGGDKIVLPVDVRVATEISASAEVRDLERTAVSAGDRIGDIGPQSEQLISEVLGSARTVMWNGPMGVFELDPFAHGTMSVARMMAEATDRGVLTVIGGGDSAAAIEAAGLADRVSHVSTGGGASLEYLAGDPLPGVEALSPRAEAPAGATESAASNDQGAA